MLPLTICALWSTYLTCPPPPDFYQLIMPTNYESFKGIIAHWSDRGLIIKSLPQSVPFEYSLGKQSLS